MPLPTLLEDVDTSKLRKHGDDRLAALKERRQPWLDFCRVVAEELLPNRLPYLVDPHGEVRGGEQNTHIVDAVGHLSLDTVAAGIASGAMPPTSPWFSLSIRGQFAADEELRLFTDEGSVRLLAMHNQSNANHVLPECQKEWVAFGTAAALIFEDDEDGHRIEAMTVGEYCIAEDSKGRVDTVYRELTMTVGQLADEFGVDRLSDPVKSLYELEKYDEVIACVHAIEPDRDGLNPDGDNEALPWRSVYWEANSSHDQVLAVRGFAKFPALVWRWGKLSGSAYGYGRGHDVLPHLVRLRRMIYRYGQAMAYKAEPPVQLPPGMQAHQVRMLPGGKTTVFGQTPITSLFKVELELKEIAAEIEKTRQDIRDTIGATLVASLRRISHQMTAREADLRTSQDLSEWLPALLRLNEELLNPYVEWLWEIAAMRGELPSMPDSLRGQIIDIEFTSPLARKQREAEVHAIIETYAIAGEIAKVRPDILDNLDPDEALRRIAQIKGAPTSTIVPIEKVRELRAARLRQQKAQAQADAIARGVEVAGGAADVQRLSGRAA